MLTHKYEKVYECSPSMYHVGIFTMYHGMCARVVLLLPGTKHRNKVIFDVTLVSCTIRLLKALF